MNHLSRNKTCAVNQSLTNCSGAHLVQENDEDYAGHYHANTGPPQEITDTISTFPQSPSSPPNSNTLPHHVLPESFLSNHHRPMIISAYDNMLHYSSTSHSQILCSCGNAQMHIPTGALTDWNNVGALSSPKHVNGFFDRVESCQIDTANILRDKISKCPYSPTRENIDTSLHENSSSSTNFKNSYENFSPRLLGGKFNESFPEKLYRLLFESAKEGNSDIASFLPHGRAFIVHQEQKFMTELIPNYFQLKKVSSFRRQLHLYGFNKVSDGPDIGAYYHAKFLRGMPRLCSEIKRTANKKKRNSAKRVGIAQNLYAMPLVEAEDNDATYGLNTQSPCYQGP